MKTTRLNEKQRAHVCKLLTEDRIVAANAVAELYEYRGITAKFFEDMIKADGLTNAWIIAIATYYRDEIIMAKEQVAKEQKQIIIDDMPAGSQYMANAEEMAFNAVKKQGAKQ